MRHAIAALVVASLAIIMVTVPGAAQSCSDYASQKQAQQQLEQGGDPSGQLDPDGNGYACDSTGLAAPAPQGLDLAQNGQPNIVDDASGVSNQVVRNSPGQEQATNGDGSGNSTSSDFAPRDRNRDRDRGERNAPADDTAAPAAEAPAEAPVASDAAAPAEEAAPTDEGTTLAAPAAAPASGSAASGTTIKQLPNTGAGASQRETGSALVALLGLLAALTFVTSRRFRRA